jgi:hypothetical protein
MDAFFKYVKEPHVLEDFKGTFDLSAKFRIPGPSEAQKSKYFEDEFTYIFQKFYHYLRANNTLHGKNDLEVEHNLRNKVDQSDLVIEFDSWLEQEGNEFTFTEKPKQTMHSNFSIPSSAPISKYQAPPTPIPAPVIRTVENKIVNTSIPFHIEKNPPPPSPLPPSTKTIAALGNFQAPTQLQPPPQRPSLYQPSMQYMPAPVPKG